MVNYSHHINWSALTVTLFVIKSSRGFASVPSSLFVFFHYQNISGNVVESVKRVERTLKEPSKEKHIVSSTVRERHLNFVKEQENNKHHEKEKEMKEKQLKKESWKRILLLIIAITVHNIPGKFAGK